MYTFTRGTTFQPLTRILKGFVNVFQSKTNQGQILQQYLLAWTFDGKDDTSN